MEIVDCGVKDMQGIESVMAISLCGSKLLPRRRLTFSMIGLYEPLSTEDIRSADQKTSEPYLDDTPTDTVKTFASAIID